MFYLFRFLSVVVCISSHVCCDCKSPPLPCYIFFIYENVAPPLQYMYLHDVQECGQHTRSDISQVFILHFAITSLHHFAVSPLRLQAILPVGHFALLPLHYQAITPFHHFAITPLDLYIIVQVCPFASKFRSWTNFIHLHFTLFNFIHVYFPLFHFIPY